MGLIERTQALIPGERVQVAVKGQVGAPPPRWNDENVTALFTNQRRVVAVTDHSITVLHASRWFWKRGRPDRILCTLPRSAPLAQVSDRWGEVQLGDETVWLRRRSWRRLQEAVQPAAAGARAH